jgi:hypothetical protein
LDRVRRFFGAGRPRARRLALSLLAVDGARSAADFGVLAAARLSRC